MMRIAMLLLAVLALSACNTMEGLGRDVQKGGEAIERSATRHGHDY